MHVCVLRIALHAMEKLDQKFGPSMDGFQTIRWRKVRCFYTQSGRRRRYLRAESSVRPLRMRLNNRATRDATLLSREMDEWMISEISADG